MDLEYTQEVSDIFDAIRSRKRLRVFLHLSEGTPPKQFLDQDQELDITRSTVQSYINDLKDTGLVETEGKEYLLTEKGEEIRQIINSVDSVVEAEKRQKIEVTEKQLKELRETVEGSDEEPELKVGVIGAGKMGEHHARMYDHLPDVQLVGISDVDLETARRVAEEYNTQVLATDDLLNVTDAVSVAVPTDLHYEVVRNCIDHGVDVLVEKPFVNDIGEGQELIEKACEEDIIIQVAHPERFNAGVMELDNLLEGEELLSAETKRIDPVPDFENSEIDLVMGWMLHDIDIMVSVLCDDEVESLDVTLGENDNSITAHIQFEEGFMATMTVGEVHLQEIRELYVTCRNLRAKVDYDEGTCKLTESDFPHVQIKKDDTEESLFEKQLSAFIDTVKNRDQPTVTAEEGLRAVKIALEIKDLIDKKSRNQYKVDKEFV